MKAKRTEQIDPAARLISTKRKLIARLNGEIKSVRGRAEDEVERINFRIRQATTLLTALERGTLKP